MKTISIKTWQIEIGVVTGCLLGVWFVTGMKPVELVGVAAVVLSFAHGQVSERFREKEEKKATPEVRCHEWSMRYFLGKEAAWLVYFSVNKSWSALVGVILFLVYPFWRKFWRMKHPVT